MSLAAILAANPVLTGYDQAIAQKEARSLGELKQASGVMSLAAALQAQREKQEERARQNRIREILAQTGGDPERAMEELSKAGMIKNASDLVAFAKLKSERAMREESARQMQGLGRLLYDQPQPAEPLEIGEGHPVRVAGEDAAQNASSGLQNRLAQLQQFQSGLMRMPNPNQVVIQRVGNEIDRITKQLEPRYQTVGRNLIEIVPGQTPRSVMQVPSDVRPLVEHNFPVGENQVQPHISLDGGQTWNPLPGSKPSAKFARMVAPVVSVNPQSAGTYSFYSANGRNYRSNSRSGEWQIQNDDGSWAQTNMPAGATRVGPAGPVLNAEGGYFQLTPGQDPRPLFSPYDTQQLRPAQKPLTTAAKLKADLDAGRIDKKTYDDQYQRITGGQEEELSDDALQQAAERYALDGTLPQNLGRGAQGASNTARILNKAAEIAKARGDTGEETRIRQIANRANTSALAQLTKQKSLILSFENTALRNADLAIAQSEVTDRTTGRSAIDKWIMLGRKKLANENDPQATEVAKLDLAVKSFANEYARVVTTVTGGGITSDTARGEIDALINRAMNKDQLRAVINFAKQEMNNRRLGYEQQERELRGAMRSPTGGNTNIDRLLQKYK